MREFEFIEWIRRQGMGDAGPVEVGPGDDCAVIVFGGDKLLVTTDQVLDGVHFFLAEHGPAAAGRKAAARNLSDIAAMAGLPVAMVATVAAPKGFSQGDLQAIYHGLRSIGDEFQCPLVGGDLAAWGDATGKLQISVTVLGRSDGIGPVLRQGAAVGDAICVTGQLGGAWRGRRHLTFVPRIHEARRLASEYDLHAMMDLSDGLASDLRHLTDAGGVGAEINAEAIPIAGDARSADDPLTAALADGEDYELLFALPGAAAERLLAAPPLETPISRIGTIVAGEGLTLIRAGRREPLTARGWEHRT